MEVLAQACISNVSKELHTVVVWAFPRGMSFSHGEITRLCLLIDAVANGFERSFSHFNREEFFESVYGDERLNFEAGRMDR